MKSTKFILILAFIGFSPFSQAQNKDCVPSEVYLIKASSGMKMRQGPSAGTPVVTYVPHGMAVLVCPDNFDKANFEGIDGHWRRVRFEDHYGYMFDGFLKDGRNLPADSLKDRFLPEVSSEFKQAVMATKITGSQGNEPKPSTLPDSSNSIVEDIQIDPDIVYEEEVPEPVVRKKPKVYQFVTETYNYCGPIQDIDPGLIWYGLYQEGDKFRFQPVELQVMKSKYNVGEGLEFDIRTNNEVPSVFLVGMDRTPDSLGTVTIAEDHFIRHPRKLFPGQKMEIYAKKDILNRNNLVLTAVGTVTDVGFCPVMTGYKLRITGEMNGNFIIQDISKDMGPMGKCGMPEVYWFGDVNQDGFADLVMVANYDEFSLFTFFLSDTNDPKVLLKKASQWRVGKCK
ncbi:MAG: hypothetical protein LPK47_04630 [Bacteroidota bacterium]|nr:hypothetical protein [Bacteroidota bacterium]